MKGSNPSRRKRVGIVIPWKTFLANHVADLAAVDFLVVPTVTFRILSVFVVLVHYRRQVVHFNVTSAPISAWTAQQILEAFPEDSAPRYLLRDRDAVHGETFRRRVEGMGIAEVLTVAQSPWQNPYAERMIGTIRRELLDHAIVLVEGHLAPAAPLPQLLPRGANSSFTGKGCARTALGRGHPSSAGVVALS